MKLLSRIRGVLSSFRRIFARPSEQPPSELGKIVRKSKSQPARPIDVVFGLDFGSASSKVVIRTPYIGKGRAVAVPFGRLGHRSSQYLLPALVRFDKNGKATLDDSDSSNHCLRDLKVSLILNPTDSDALARATAHLALVLRHGRDWFVSSQRTVFPTERLRWCFNLGIPSAGYGDDLLRRAFERIAVGAWALSSSERAVTIDACRNVVAASRPITSDVEIEIVPEVAAEAVGYARSQFRNSDLHLIVDVGATTLDVCGFVLHQKDAEDAYSILTALVERRGVHELHRKRLEAIGAILPDAHRDRLTLDDPLAVIPDSIEEYFGRNHHNGRDYQEVDREFLSGCVNQLRHVVHFLRNKRYPNSPRWSEGLPIYMCGGGARMHVFTRAVERVSASCSKYYLGVGPFRIRQLPVPINLASKDISTAEFQRLAVAYGLSFDRLAIGEITPPEMISDIPPPLVRPSRDMISKEQV